MTRRQLMIVAIGGSLGLLVTAASIVHLRISGQVDQAVQQASQPHPGPRFEPIPARVFDAPSTLWTDTNTVHDCALKQGRLFAATEGGLVPLAPGATPRSVSTLRNSPGLADHALTAATARGQTIVTGSRSGTLSIFERGNVRSFRIGDGRFGTIVDLIWQEEALFLATSSGKVLRVDSSFESVTALTPTIEGGATALALGPEEVTVAGADGAVYAVDGSRLRPLASPARGAPPTRLTALAWIGDRLFAGSPTELYRVDEGELHSVRRDLFVTHLVGRGQDLVVATFDDGVFLLNAAQPSASPRRHILAGQRVDRLRPDADQIIAVGPDLVARLDIETFEVRRFELAPSLSSNHITALAQDDQRRLWVGHFDAGVDIIDQNGALNRGLPESTRRALNELGEINDLIFDANARAMLVATSRGVLELQGEQHRLISTDEGLIGETVTAILIHGEKRIYATNRGLTIDSGGMRSIYAFHGLPSNRLYALDARPDGRVVVGTLAGAALVDELRVRDTVRATPSGLGANWCAAVVATDEGTYVGTVGGGLNLWTNDGMVRRFALPNGDERYTINPGAMLAHGDRLYVGTLENGLLILSRDRSEWVGLEQPMPGAAVTAIAIEVGSRELILGTDRGLLRLDGDSLGG